MAGSSSVIITSSSPNNALVAVVEQTVDSTGAPVGEPRQAALLDDGQSVVVRVSDTTVFSLVQAPRNAAPAPVEAAPGEDDPAAPDEAVTPIGVIGGEVA